MKIFDIAWKIISVVATIIVFVFYVGKNLSTIESNTVENKRAVKRIEESLKENSKQIAQGNQEIIKLLHKNRDFIHRVDKKVAENQRDLIHLSK